MAEETITATKAAKAATEAMAAHLPAVTADMVVEPPRLQGIFV